MKPTVRLFLFATIGLLAPAVFGDPNPVAPAPAPSDSSPVTFTLTGRPLYFHRHHVEVEGVPEAEQAEYQSSWTGELGLRISGLKPEPYRVHLDYTEMDMNAPRTRVFDILLNGQVVQKEICIYHAVGTRRVLAFDFTVTPQHGVITYEQRCSVPKADSPSFTLIRLYDAAGHLVAKRSAYEMRPADWELRDYLNEIFHPPPLNTHRTPPWPGTYKLRPDETSRLTAADVVGPDGIVYPNWTHVGIPGGIPTLAPTLSAADYGAKPDGDQDSSAALQRAIDALQARGGGVLFIPAGRYYLDRPIFVTGDHCVLRGAGPAKTRLVSRFSMSGMKPEFQGLPANGAIGPSSIVTVWVDPTGLTDLKLQVGGKLVYDLARPGLWETQIQYAFLGSRLLEVADPGRTDLTVSVTYRDGTVRTTTQPVTLAEAPQPQPRPYAPLGMVNFVGRGLAATPRVPLATDGKRGDQSVEVPSAGGFRVGDRIQIVGPVTRRWRKVLRTGFRDGYLRGNQYEITAVQGTRLFFSEPLRIEFPVIDSSYVQKIEPILRSGIEDLGFEQLTPAFVHGVVFNYGWECWARGLAIVHAGDKALYMPNSKRCEVHDSVFDRSWCNDGGSAYVGWESSFDCLMENVTTYAMRHAPVVQWASSGNVIRLSTFHGSDAQWHAGWTNENLYEELAVESSQTTGSYGNGGYATGPDDTAHGPNGPRNVVYNCDISSIRTGLWLGGMNEGWLILYNRFVVGRGPAIMAKDASFDHTIRGNVFVMMEPEPAAIFLGSADCTGIDVVGNRFYGPVGQLFGGATRPAVDQDNRVRRSGDIARPRPAVLSIYEWEQSHRDEILSAHPPVF
ncbi:MAG: glycosyl hydrolase family 28-related protein [Opitutales bacterium]